MKEWNIFRKLLVLAIPIFYAVVIVREVYPVYWLIYASSSAVIILGFLSYVTEASKEIYSKATYTQMTSFGLQVLIGMLIILLTAVQLDAIYIFMGLAMCCAPAIFGSSSVFRAIKKL